MNTLAYSAILLVATIGTAVARDYLAIENLRDQFQQSSAAEQLSSIKNKTAFLICPVKDTGNISTSAAITEEMINPEQLKKSGCVIKAREERNNWLIQVSPR
jgi:hypothetical protein